ncbi:hypothetical protein GCK72_015769 [Caenorhabditis remanei]|uniref:C-type lectin domain-containing protein n=1 Tax=Caenorhabditis remanei TaxID=31234 RepID=A0A6A5GXH8_CAERE|nr:hypothetical protein GCK72_015769 [Caenorhabditis remanei]KAF1759304.1 hypothetical protein GCK72_015769 [Caenorhabditis remanei]
MGGVFKQRENPQAIRGDTCDLTFRMAYRDEVDAKEFCELYAPWRLIKVILKQENERKTVTCSVEATMTCKSGWQMMFGYCYQMPEKHSTYSQTDAQELCQSRGGSIAFIRHRYIIGVWKRHFSSIGQIWVDASPTFDQHIKTTGTVDGTALALAFTGKHFDFSVFPNSLIRINPNIKLQVLCEYQPPMTPAEVNYLGRRYSEIYYPSIPVDHGVLIRSASSYTSSYNQLDVCEKMLKSYLSSDVGVYVPDKKTLNAMLQKPLPLILHSRSSATDVTDKSKLDEVMCAPRDMKLKVAMKSSVIQYYFLEEFKMSSTCQNMGSTGITHSSKSTPQLVPISDSRSLPIWCKLGTATRPKFTVPDGYSVFRRKNGQYVAHALIQEYVYQPEALSGCKARGAILSGMESMEEGAFLEKLALDAKLTKGRPEFGIWMGGRRRAECLAVVKGFEETGPCTRDRVYEWIDGSSHTFEAEFWKDEKDEKNPNRQNTRTLMLSFIYLKNASWADPNSNGYLDDCLPDWAQRPFFCQVNIHVEYENI